MTRLMVAMAAPGRYTAFHAAVIAVAVTGAIVLVTAGDLGAFSPMLLALGFYAICFGLIAEGVFGLRKLASYAARRRLVAIAQRSDLP